MTTDAVTSFNERVWAVVRKIPRGKIATYGQIAALVDRPRAARAVGGAMAACPTGVPWHRVVNSAGKISRRSRASSMITQRMLLEREGITLRRGRVALRRHRWQIQGNGRGVSRFDVQADGGRHATGIASELLGREREDRPRQGARGRASRFRFDLDG